MTTPEFCLDCRAVDPEMTAGGLTSKQMQEITKQATAAKRAETAMLYRVRGRADYEGDLRRARLRNQRRRDRAKAA
jgi:hypothetical protein